MMPVSSASSPDVTAGSMATTMRVIAGAEQPARLDRTVRPQRAGRVLEQLGFELLPAELGAFVFANDLSKKCRRQVGAIFVAGAAGHHADRVAHQITDQFRGPRRRRLSIGLQSPGA